MTLNKREKLFAVVVGVLALVALYWLWPSNQESLADLRKDNDDISEKVKLKEAQVQNLQKAKDRLAAWQRIALPSDLKEAARQYNGWLSELAHDVDFKNVNIHPVDPQNHRNIYEEFSFTVNCQGTLGKLTQFLYKFYSVGYLHKIRSITITPKNTTDLDLIIAVEALSLPGSKQTDKLSAEKSNRLKLASLEEYKKAIVDRNLFAAYSQPRNPPRERDRPSPPSKLDPLQFSYLTAIIEADGIPEAWLFERTTGETLKVHEGEEFTIGKVKAKVNRIGYNDIEIEIDGKTHTVGYGNNLKM
ncbi:MAG: hypothetical protein ABSA77_02050 [Thermoguttaceae bacterium]|jgi:Tfp pilus assembly protein PilO